MERTLARTNIAALRQSAARLQAVAAEIGSGEFRQTVLHHAAAAQEAVPVLIRKYQHYNTALGRRNTPVSGAKTRAISPEDRFVDLRMEIESCGAHVDALKRTILEMIEDRVELALSVTEATNVMQKLGPVKTSFESACTSFDNALRALLR